MKCNCKQKAWNLFLFKAFIWLRKNNNNKMYSKALLIHAQQHYYQEQGPHNTPAPFIWVNFFRLPEASKSMFTILETKDCSDSTVWIFQLGIIRQWLYISLILHFYFLENFCGNNRIPEIKMQKCVIKIFNASISVLLSSWNVLIYFIIFFYSPFPKIILLTFKP